MLAAAAMLPLAGMARLMLSTVVAYRLIPRISHTRSKMLPQERLMPFCCNWDHAAVLRPSKMPYATGAANLRKVKARTPEDLCISQVKAKKLPYMGLHSALPVTCVIGIVTEFRPYGTVESLAHGFTSNCKPGSPNWPARCDSRLCPSS